MNPAVYQRPQDVIAEIMRSRASMSVKFRRCITAIYGMGDRDRADAVAFLYGWLNAKKAMP